MLSSGWQNFKGFFAETLQASLRGWKKSGGLVRA